MAEKNTTLPPREASVCPEGGLSGVHIPSGLNGIKWTDKGRCWCVYVCMQYVCMYLCVHVCSVCMCACVCGVCVCLQHDSSKASIFWHSAFFIVQLSHPYMTTGKTIALTRLWRWRGPSGLRWVWRNGRGPHLEGRQAPQASSAFRTPTAGSLQSRDRRVRPRLV